VGKVLLYFGQVCNYFYRASRLREEYPCLIGWFTWVSERCSRSDFCPRLKIVRFGHVCNVCTKTLCFVPSRKVRSESKTTCHIIGNAPLNHLISHENACTWKFDPRTFSTRNYHVTNRDLLADSLSQRMSRAVSSENLTLAISNVNVTPEKVCALQMRKQVMSEQERI